MERGERKENRLGGGGVFFLYRIPTPAQTHFDGVVRERILNMGWREEGDLQVIPPPPVIEMLNTGKICPSLFT